MTLMDIGIDKAFPGSGFTEASLDMVLLPTSVICPMETPSKFTEFFEANPKTCLEMVSGWGTVNIAASISGIKFLFLSKTLFAVCRLATF